MYKISLLLEKECKILRYNNNMVKYNKMDNDYAVSIDMSWSIRLNQWFPSLLWGGMSDVFLKTFRTWKFTKVLTSRVLLFWQEESFSWNINARRPTRVEYDGGWVNLRCSHEIMGPGLHPVLRDRAFGSRIKYRPYRVRRNIRLILRSNLELFRRSMRVFTLYLFQSFISKFLKFTS